MRTFLAVLLGVFAGLLLHSVFTQEINAVIAGCKDTYYSNGADTVDYTDTTPSYSTPTPFTRTKHWKVFWLDGYERVVDPAAQGVRVFNYWFLGGTFDCDPYFNQPVFVDITNDRAQWTQDTAEGYYDSAAGQCKQRTSVIRVVKAEHICSRTSSSCTTPGYAGGCPSSYSFNSQTGLCCPDGGGGPGGCAEPAVISCLAELPPPTDNGGACPEYTVDCQPCRDSCASSPILIDVRGDGFRLTDAAGGVAFNFARQGLVQMSWTVADADEAFLVLDRNIMFV
jgi:hypothetical protein